MLHFVYSFSPSEVFDHFKSLTSDDPIFSENPFLTEAQAIVENASPTLLIILEYLRFEKAWFGTKDETITHTYQWYLIILASHLRPSNSLTYKYAEGYSIFMEYLQTHWSENDIELFFSGRPLSSLIYQYEIPVPH